MAILVSVTTDVSAIVNDDVQPEVTSDDIPLPGQNRPAAEVIVAEASEILARFLQRYRENPARGRYVVLLPRDVTTWGVDEARARLQRRRWMSRVSWGAPSLLHVFPRMQSDEGC